MTKDESLDMGMSTVYTHTYDLLTDPYWFAWTLGICLTNTRRNLIKKFGKLR